MSYIIIKHHVLDISMVIKKFTSNIITLILLLFSFWLCFYLINNKIIFFIATSALACFWALLFYSVSNFLVTTTRRTFVKGWYNLESVLNTISNKLSTEKTRERIFKILAQEIDEALQLEKISFLIAVRGKNQKLIKYAFYQKAVSTNLDYVVKDIERDNDLIIFLDKYLNLTFFTDLEQKIQNVATAFGCSSKDLFLPFHSPEMFEGLIILGERSCGSKYKETDHIFLETIINNVSSILYRLTPYEKIEEEFKRAIELASISKTVVTLHHEINSPLTAILGSASLLKDKELSQETIKKLSTMIYEQTKAISLIIKKLNNITKPVTSEYAPGSGIEMLEI